ncbi:hypothetical protein [Streptomyces sp. NPDC088762]|uniref:hypothetical protein n=1 Tax=Streptomyces sp. NPDC088762 TaxID=3365891 RepID=UPI0037FDFE06
MEEGLAERLGLGDVLGDADAEERDALGEADFEALGDAEREAEADGLPVDEVLGPGDDSAGAMLGTGDDAFASSSAVSLPEEAGSTHSAAAVPPTAITAPAPSRIGSSRREARPPVRSSGPPPRVFSDSAVPGADAGATGPAGPAAGTDGRRTVASESGQGGWTGGTGIPYAGVPPCSGTTTRGSGGGGGGAASSASAGSGNDTYGRTRKGSKPATGAHRQPAPTAPQSGQCSPLTGMPPWLLPAIMQTRRAPPNPVREAITGHTTQDGDVDPA